MSLGQACTVVGRAEGMVGYKSEAVQTRTGEGCLDKVNTDFLGPLVSIQSGGAKQQRWEGLILVLD